MSEAIANIIVVLHVFFWDGKAIHVLSNRRVVVERPANAGWSATYCVSDRDGLTGDSRCQNYECNECWHSWGPGYPHVEQGTIAQYVSRQTHELRSELAILQARVEQDMIEVRKVQEVGAKYAVHQEWCSVYEQAFEELGISPLSSDSDVRITISFNTTLTAARRQRLDDTDFMRQSLTYYRIEEMLGGTDIFDHDFDMSGSVDGIEVEIELR